MCTYSEMTKHVIDLLGIFNQVGVAGKDRFLDVAKVNNPEELLEV